jgi:hypothetical protein
MTEREEQAIELKSQIVIYKQKAAGYKNKLKVELDEFKKKALQEERENCVR